MRGSTSDALSRQWVFRLWVRDSKTMDHQVAVLQAVAFAGKGNMDGWWDGGVGCGGPQQ